MGDRIPTNHITNHEQTSLASLPEVSHRRFSGVFFEGFWSRLAGLG
jgi:hypothetical protein